MDINYVLNDMWDLTHISYAIPYFNPKDFENYYFKIKYDIDSIKILYVFLKDNDAYEAYFNNRVKHKPFNSFRTNILSNIIDSSFKWDETKEGHGF